MLLEQFMVIVAVLG